MLGFSPVGSRAISGSPFGLVAVPALLTAALTIAFAVEGRVGAVTPMRSQIGVNFPVSGSLRVNQAIAASVSITFDIDAILRVAGKPIIISAIPQSYAVRASQADYVTKALPQNFTIRGSR